MCHYWHGYPPNTPAPTTTPPPPPPVSHTHIKTCLLIKYKNIIPDNAFFFLDKKVLIFFLFLHENICCGYSLEVPHLGTSGPSCSKLTTLLVNDSLKFTSSDTQICWNFLLKNIRILYIESAKTVNEMTLNKLDKLTTLWTTGPWLISTT